MNQTRVKNCALFRYERVRHVANSETNLGFGGPHASHLHQKITNALQNKRLPLHQLIYSEETKYQKTFQEAEILYENLNRSYILMFRSQACDWAKDQAEIHCLYRVYKGRNVASLNSGEKQTPFLMLRCTEVFLTEQAYKELGDTELHLQDVLTSLHHCKPPLRIMLVSV